MNARNEWLGNPSVKCIVPLVVPSCVPPCFHLLPLGLFVSSFGFLFLLQFLHFRLLCFRWNDRNRFLRCIQYKCMQLKTHVSEVKELSHELSITFLRHSLTFSDCDRLVVEEVCSTEEDATNAG